MRNCTGSLHEAMLSGDLAIFAAVDLTTGEPIANLSLERNRHGWWLDEVLGKENDDAAGWLEDDLDALVNELLPGTKPPPVPMLPAGLLDEGVPF